MYLLNTLAKVKAKTKVIYMETGRSLFASNYALF